MILEPDLDVMFSYPYLSFLFVRPTYIKLQGHCNTYTTFVVLHVINSEISKELLFPVEVNSVSPLIGLFSWEHALHFLHEKNPVHCQNIHVLAGGSSTFLTTLSPKLGAFRR